MGNLGVEWCLGPFWVIDTAYYTTFELDLIEPLYFYYYTRHVGLNHLKDGTSNPSLTRDRFLRQPIPLPPLADQKRIAALLGALDDRIEVNRRMNLTLEAMAQALFHRQFVDFDGRDDLMETEAGPLPSGWRNSSIGDLVELAYGKSLPKKRREDGPVPVYGSGGLTGRHSEALVEGPGIVVGRKGSIGTIYWEDDDFFPIDTTFYVVPRTEDVTLRWLYFRFVEMDLVRLGSDSAVPGLNRNAVYAQEWCVPPAVEVAAFEEVVTPLMNRMASNEAQSATLAALRDALLPKLVSGEIRVPEAEAAVEAVA
jgi:type I restriction enzyme S subunit